MTILDDRAEITLSSVSDGLSSADLAYDSSNLSTPSLTSHSEGDSTNGSLSPYEAGEHEGVSDVLTGEIARFLKIANCHRLRRFSQQHFNMSCTTLSWILQAV